MSAATERARITRTGAARELFEAWALRERRAASSLCQLAFGARRH